MPSILARVSPDAPRPASLRAQFAWVFTGHVLYGASQWAILSLIAKLGDSEMLGRYALAVAVATPVAMLAHLNLRAVLSTDVERRHPFGDYLAVRLGAGLFGLAVVVAIAFASGYPAPVAALVAVMGLALSLENLSDLYYGLMQRREEMRLIAGSMIARGLLSATVLGIVLWLARSLLAAVSALVVVRIVLLAAYDRPAASGGEDPRRSGIQAQWEILRAALPLGAVLMLVSLTTNAPRYSVEHHLGVRSLGAFAAAASFAAAGAAVVNAMGHSATARLARHFQRRDLAEFRHLVRRLVGLAAILGVAGVLGAAVFGRLALRLAYRPEYEEHSALLVALMGAATAGYVAIILGFVVTSARSFAAQVPLLLIAAATSAAASWLLAPVMGLMGAALALAMAASVQIGGQLLLLRRALRRAEAAA